MPAKVATPGPLKIKVFWNEVDDVIIYALTNKILSLDSNYIVDAAMWPKFGNCSFSMRQFDKDLTMKTAFFEGWSWFKFNNLGQTIGMNFSIYKSVMKWLKLKVRKFRGLVSTFVEVTREKQVGEGVFWLPYLPPILNNVNPFLYLVLKFF